MDNSLKLSNIKFCKTHENSKLPHKTHSADAGYDLFWCPEKSEDWIYINPNESKVLPTGLKVYFPEGYVLEVKNRSGMASKGLVVGACIVDSTYAGEIFVNLHNISNSPKKITVGDKIAQFLVYKIEAPRIEEITNTELEECHRNSSRGSGAFGSTGN
jgi:dUTP pyrophosphatase